MVNSAKISFFVSENTATQAIKYDSNSDSILSSKFKHDLKAEGVILQKKFTPERFYERAASIIAFYNPHLNFETKLRFFWNKPWSKFRPWNRGKQKPKIVSHKIITRMHACIKRLRTLDCKKKCYRIPVSHVDTKALITKCPIRYWQKTPIRIVVDRIIHYLLLGFESVVFLTFTYLWINSYAVNTKKRGIVL